MNDHLEMHYLPEMWTVDKSAIYAARAAIESGIEYAQESLVDHDKKFGRSIRKNRILAETMEKDILSMQKALKQLREV